MSRKDVIFFLLLTLLRYVTCIRLPYPNIVCYYDSRSSTRIGFGLMNVDSIKPLIKHCTHLIYGFASINSHNYTIEPLNDDDLDVERGNYKKVIDLKYDLPQLKVLLSVGGNADKNDTDKYLRLLETRERRTNFVDHAAEYLKKYGFDGIDLAWQFPTMPPEIVKSKLDSIFTNIKQFFSGKKSKPQDEKTVIGHRDGFTNLISYMKPVFDEQFLMFTVTQLPNVNASAYLYVPTLRYYVDFVNLMAIDFNTPKRYPNIANYPSPLYEISNERPRENVNYIAKYWIEKGMPREKLIITMPIFARTWKLKKPLTSGEKPPFEADGPGEMGPYTLEPGLLANYEYCASTNASNNILQRLSPSNSSYITRNNNREFIGYDTSDAIVQKLKYVVNNDFGGVALYELSLDDFQGICNNNGKKYPRANEIIRNLNRLMM